MLMYSYTATLPPSSSLYRIPQGVVENAVFSCNSEVVDWRTSLGATAGFILLIF